MIVGTQNSSDLCVGKEAARCRTISFTSPSCSVDTLQAEYGHKPVGLVTVSAGGLGGARLSATMLPTLRGLGMVVTRTDLTVSHVGRAFDEHDEPVEERLNERADSFVRELVWMTNALTTARKKSPNGE